MSDHYREMAEAYADGTDYRAQAIAAMEEADSDRAEKRREEMAAIPHKFWGSELIPGYCVRCGRIKDHRVHNTRKEDE